MIFLNPENAIFFVIPLLLWLFMLKGKRIRIRLLSHFNSASGYWFKMSWGSFVLLLGSGLAILALMRPVSNPREQTVNLQGRNIVFLVDVSRSMLAQDLVPNRLDRARFDIRSSASVFYGHRVGLVAFAGESVLKCPLTTDYGYFLQAVEDLSVWSVTRGGSSIGDAIRFVINELYPEDSSSLDIILITDGEDQNTFPVEAARKAGDKGVRIITVGMGDPDKGTPIPETSYQGEKVYSYPDKMSLQEIAAGSDGGWSISIGTGSIDVTGIVKNLKGRVEETGTDRHISYDEYFQWLLLPAFLMMIAGFIYRRIYES